jgi:formylglycine-generating enzyme required for sulfatase activity
MRLVLIAFVCLSSAAPDPAAAPVRAGSVRVNPKDGLKYLWIPPGSFMMGCSPGDTECRPDERPAHEVVINRGFWLGQTPVTQAAYQRVTGSNPSNSKGNNLPVEQVTWDKARSYCQAIGGRLPTEAEWEYAARAGSTGARYGSLAEIAWYVSNSGLRTHEVGRKKPNGFGLYDMLGNVWQWTADWYDDRAYDQAGPRQDPAGPPGAVGRTLRGGSYGSYPMSVRASARLSPAGRMRDWDFGLRCVGE